MTVLVVVGSIGLAILGKNRGADSKKTLTIAGWSVEAPGRKTSRKNTGAEQAVAIGHSRTGSEFAIAHKRVAQRGQEFTVDSIVDAMSRNPMLRISQPRSVSRAGLEGLRFTLKTTGRPAGECEMYKINRTSVILITYISALSKENANMGKMKCEPEQLEKFDDPEAFFASLRRAS